MEARLELRDRLNLLIEAAGNPTLDTIAAHAATFAEPGSEAPVPGGGTISAWTTKNPRRARFWDSLRWVLEYLIERAKARGEAPEPPDLYLMRRWKRLYEQSAEPTTTTVYQGLAAFQRANADMFYGRDTEIDALVAVLGATVLDEAPGIVAVVAPSGAGKSSLLQAGLLPALEERGLGSIPDSMSWPTLVITPGQHPLTSIAAAIPELDGVFTTGEDPTTTTQSFARARAAVRSHITDSAAPTARLVLIVDQFEEVFTLAAEAERRTFIDLLGSISEGGSTEPPPALVVLGMRADFSHNCFGYPPLEDALQNRQRLLPAMTISQLTEAIEGPAAAGGVKVEPALVHLLLQDAGLINADGSITGRSDSGILPLLSHALRITWDRRRAGRGPMSAKGYLDVGRLRGAVQQTADEAWNTLPEQQQEAGLWILLNLVHIGADPSRDTRIPREWRELLNNAADHEAAQQARDVLVRERLLTADTDTVQITHEALMRSWPRLATAIDNHRDGLARRQRVEEAASAWEQSQNPRWWRRVGAAHNPDLLWRGEELGVALAWAREATDLDRPSSLGRQFLRHGAQRRRRRTSLVMGVIGLLTLTTVTAGAEALAANSERNNAIFAEVVAQADRLQASDPSLAAQLDLVAHRMRPDDAEVTGRILSTQNAPLAAVLPNSGNAAIDYTAFSHGGRLLVTAGNSIQLWDLNAEGKPRPLGPPLFAGHTYVSAAAFTPDGHLLVSTGGDGTLRIWDVTQPAHPVRRAELSEGHGASSLLDVSPDGHTVATGGADGTVTLWTITDPTHPHSPGLPLTGHTGIVRAIAFSPDGHTLAAGGDDHSILLYNVTDPGHPARVGDVLRGHSEAVRSVAFSPDGHLLASGSDDKSVRMWNVANPAQAVALGDSFGGQKGSVWSVAFSPDGRVLASGSQDGTTKLWTITDPASPNQLGADLFSRTGGIFAVGFSADGRYLATGGDDGTTQLWALPATVLTGPSSRVFSLAFSPDGRTLAVASHDHSIWLWNMTDRHHPALLGPPLVGHNGIVTKIAFSPDGRTLASSSGDDHTTRLWDLTDLAQPTPIGAPLPQHTQYEAALAFTPDGRTLVTSGTDTSVQIWDVSDRGHPTPLGKPIADHRDFVQNVAISPDRARTVLAIASYDGTVTMWDITTPMHPQPLGAPLQPGSGKIRGLAFSPDGRTLATTGEDKTIHLFTVADPNKPTGTATLVGHHGAVHSLAFTPDGATLASGGADKTARVWNLADNASISTPLTGHTGTVTGVRFSPDGQTLATGSDDDTVRVWDLTLTDSITRICDTTQGALNPDQWEQLLPELPYTPGCS